MDAQTVENIRRAYEHLTHACERLDMLYSENLSEKFFDRGPMWDIRHSATSALHRLGELVKGEDIKVGKMCYDEWDGMWVEPGDPEWEICKANGGCCR